jgi:hypothetical protein
MHRFQLETADGTPLGPVELQRPDWPIGSLIYKGGAVEELPAPRSRD